MYADFDLSKVRLRGRRLIVSKTQEVGSKDAVKVGEGLLYAPALELRHRQSYGIEGTVDLVGPDCVETFKPGDRVIINEFAGDRKSVV